MNDREWTGEWTEVTRARDRRSRSNPPDDSSGKDRDGTEPDGAGPQAAVEVPTPPTGPPPGRGGKLTRAGRAHAEDQQSGQASRHGHPTAPERRRRITHRALPLALVATVAFTYGAISAAGSAKEDLARAFVASWTAQDFPAMYDDLTPAAQQNYSLDQFKAAYELGQQTSTAKAISSGKAKEQSGGATINVGVNTTIFGEVNGSIEMPMTQEKIDWEPNMVFPGLRSGERLARRLEVGTKRASILASDGTPLAEGDVDNRTSPLGGAAVDVVGNVGIADSELAPVIQGRGYPADQPTGISGLELAFNPALAGVPAGELLAVKDDGTDVDVGAGVDGRVLAQEDGKPGKNVKTTIDPQIQSSAVAALGGAPGGVAVLDARNGQIRALAGQAFSFPRPPGSTFKIITATAGLTEKLVKPTDVFPVIQEINAGGRVMANANKEFCGGTFVQSFAHSCNTVFAPLGVEVGEDKLVGIAEDFGFNQEPTLFNREITEAVNPGMASLPEDPGTDVDLAATSIGQGQVLATPLAMASVAQTIASGGVRYPTPIALDPALRSKTKKTRVTSTDVAKVMRAMMRAVVTEGTGSQAQVGKVEIAGKTGTAELGEDPDQPELPPLAPGEEAPPPVQILDAWFAAFAPYRKPRLAIAVVVFDAGADGGDVAAPIAGRILTDALD